MKKNINYIMFLTLLFFMNIFVVNAMAGVFSIKDGASYKNLSQYGSDCAYETLDILNTELEYLELTKDANNQPIIFVKKVPTKTVTVNLLCHGDQVTVNLESSASVYEGYSEAEDLTTIELKTRATLDGYSYCENKDNRTGKSFEYISLESSDKGPMITVKKVPNIGTKTEYIKCTTSDGRSNEVSVKITQGKSHVPPLSYVDGNDNSKSENVSSDCESIFGDIKDDGKNYDPNNNGLPSVAYVLQKIFDFMKVLGPLLVLVLSIMDLVKVVASSDKDSLNKFLKTTSKRLIYAVLLFVVPTILNLVLSWVTTSNGTCGIH